MTEKITPIPTSTRLTKENLRGMLNDSVDEINKIRGLYEDFFASEGENPSKLEEIEAKLADIAREYSDLFDDTPSKIESAKTALEEIKAYHEELLDGATSIKADIDESQTRITNFYNELFSSSDGGVTEDGGKQALIETAIKSITDFDTKLTNTTTGYKFIIEKAKDEILKAHSDLFKKNKLTGKSASEQLADEIQQTHAFHDNIKDNIIPFINDQKSTIVSVGEDIKSKQTEVNSLLSNATVRTLAQGYSQSMQTYGNPIIKKMPKGSRWWQVFGHYLRITVTQLTYFIKFIGSYVLFIGPLVLIGVLFVVNFNSIYITDLTKNTIDFSGTEYILYKLTIALPLLWVSWFGQRSISHRKRLFEEYNHKLRVVQMYMLFTAQKNTYTLSDDAMKQLEAELLATIARNPSQVYGKDETMVDKIINIFTKQPATKTEESSENG